MTNPLTQDPNECTQCRKGVLHNTGEVHQNTDGHDVETWACDVCDYTEGRNAVNPKPGNRETSL
jgi:hypothetical protein